MVKLFLKLIFLFFSMAARVWALPPQIVSFGSTGGNTQNKTDGQDIMYLVTSGDNLSFTVTLDQAVSFEWAVNKSTEVGQVVTVPATTDTFNWTVPSEKSIWEIYLRCSNGANESVHKEWVVSTFTAAEAPDFFDYFCDMQFTSRNQKDPWERNLPEWVKLYSNADFSEGYVKSLSNPPYTYLSTNALSGKNITKGTFKFWMYWNDGGSANIYSPTNGFSIMNNSPLNTNVRQGLILENPYDEHIWFMALDASGKPYNFESEGNNHGINEYPVNVNGWTASAGWHRWTMIIDENDEVYAYMDDDAVYSTRGRMDRETWSTPVFNYIQLALTGQTSSYYSFSDGVEVYRDKYLFPKNLIYYDQIADEIVVKNGNPNQNTTLQQINEAIANPGIFNYDSSNNICTSYKPIVIERGGTLRIENTTFVPYYKIFLKNSANLYVNNSTVTSTTPYKIGYTSYNESYQVNPNSSFILRVGAQSITIKNSVIDNASFSSSMSPYVLDIQNTKFTNMNSDFTVGQAFQMFPMYKFNLGNVMFDKDIAFVDINQSTLSGYMGHNEYLAATDIGARNIKVSKIGGNSWDSQINLKNVQFSSITVIEFGTGIGIANISYYLDVLVQDWEGKPVTNANVTVSNEIDPNILPMNLNVSQKWSSHGSGGFYERNYYKNDILTSTLTGPDGHTPLPSNSVNSLVIMDFWKNSSVQENMNYTVTAEKDGIIAELKGVDPDVSWYRPDPNVPTKTVTVVLGVKTDTRLDESKGFVVYPNPYIKGKSPTEKITFGNLVQEATIKIYTPAGRLVTEIEHQAATDGGSEEWDVSAVSSGIYLYAVITSEKTNKGKVSVIK